MHSKYSVHEIVLCALAMAVICTATLVIKIPNPIDGYFNLGDGFILLFSAFLNPFAAFLASGLGSGLADLLGGYGHYFLFTLVIKGLEGLLISWLIQRFGRRAILPSYVIGSIWMVTGYFFAKWILKGSALIAAGGILENIGQGIVGILVALAALPMAAKVLSRFGSENGIIRQLKPHSLRQK